MSVPVILALAPFILSFNWAILALLITGCAAAWALSHALARLIRRFSIQASPALNHSQGVPIRRLWYFESMIIVATALMVALLVIASTAVIDANESLAMSISGLLAIAGTPLAVVLLEVIQLPHARRLAAHAEGEVIPASLSIATEPAQRRHAA